MRQIYPYMSVQEISVLISYVPMPLIKAHVDGPGLSSIEDSDKSVHKHRLA